MEGSRGGAIWLLDRRRMGIGRVPTRWRVRWGAVGSGVGVGLRKTVGALACPLEARLGALEGVGTRSGDESVGALDPVGAPGGGAGCPRVVLGLGVEGEWPGRA